MMGLNISFSGAVWKIIAELSLLLLLTWNTDSTMHIGLLDMVYLPSNAIPKI